MSISESPITDGDKKMRLKRYNQKYRAKNKEKLKELNRRKYLLRKGVDSLDPRPVSLNEKDIKQRAYYHANKAKICAQRKIALAAKPKTTIHKKKRNITLKTAEHNKLIQKLACQRWYLKNRAKVLAKTSQYNKDNRKHVSKRVIEWARNKKKTDINFRLRIQVRARIKDAVRGKIITKTRDLIGCSTEFLRTYLESKFQPEMNWNNWAIDGWHIDHIKPLAAFDLTNPDELKKANHFTNLQPLWAIDNLKKGSKIINNNEVLGECI